MTNTRSLLFFAVPHRGFRRSYTIYAQSMTRTLKVLGLASVFLPGRSTSFVPSANETTRSLEAFAPISDRFEIFTLCDSIRSITDRAIDPKTYYLGLPNERFIHINSTFNNIAKFSSLNTDLMKVISAIRSTVIRFGLALQTRDWASQQVFRLDSIERSGFFAGISI